MNHSFLRHHGAGMVFVLIFSVSFVQRLEATRPGEGDWPCFRGPSGHGLSSDARIPTEWSDSKNLKWKLEMPGKGYSSPIVVGEHVLVTCYSDAGGGLEKLKRHLVCVDRNTGKTVWSRIIPSAAPENQAPSFGADHGFASHTPVSDGERVYVLFGNTGVMAFDMKGKQLWRKSVGKENAARFGSAASPILYKDLLIVTAASESKTLCALDKKSGKEVWKTKKASLLSTSYCTPVVFKNKNGEDELVISVREEVWSLNPGTGKLNWYAGTLVDTAACPSLVGRDNVVYVIGGRRGARAAIRLGGKDDVTKTNVLWSMNGGSYVPSPVLHKGHLYWVNDRGIVSCVDAKTGKEVSKKRIRGRFYASLVLVRDKLYAVSRFEGTFVLKATPDLEVIAHNTLSDKSDFSGSPAVSRGQLIFRSDKFLYCVEAK